MKENIRILMKISIANELFTTSGNAMATAIPIASKTRLRARRRFPPEAGRLEGERQQQHGEDHDQPGVGADILNAQRFRDAHQQAGDERADHVAERAHHHRDKGHQGKHLPDKGISRIKRHQQRAGGARERERDAESDAKNPVGVDAHQGCDIAVLRRGAHRLAEIGGVQEYPERAAQQHRHHKGDQFGHRDVKPAEMKGFVRVGCVNGAVVRREQHQREVQQ